jgi:phospholipid/cholesterol/gamma-HCH transport system permease protein
MPGAPLPAPTAPPPAGAGGAGGTGGTGRMLAVLHRATAAIGRATHASVDDTRTTLGFVGELLQAAGRVAGGMVAGVFHRRRATTRSHLRGADLLAQLDQSGPRSLPIVSLVSGLVGVILAYMGAVQLQRFGAQTFIADLVTIGAVREVAALMTGVILSGRIGAAFAAQLGSMQANEEIDALRALGVDPMEHLVLPRVLGLLLVAPLLTAYAALVAVVAGGLVASTIFGVPAEQYAYKSLQALTLPHVLVGLGKGTVYGLLVALAGCRQGLHSGRSAQAVGQAVTASVVQAIVWIVVAASALTIALQRLGW